MSVTAEGLAYALGLRDSPPPGYRPMSVGEMIDIVQAMPEHDQPDIRAPFLARYLLPTLDRWEGLPFKPLPTATADVTNVLIAFNHDDYVTLFRRRQPTRYEDVVQRCVTVIAEIGPSVPVASQQAVFDHCSLTHYLLMYSDQDPRRTLRDAARARSNVIAWGRQFGRRTFGDVPTNDIFARLTFQLDGNRAFMRLIKEAREHAANEDTRCSLPDCARLDRKFSRCARCGTVRYCSPDHREHWSKHKRHCFKTTFG